MSTNKTDKTKVIRIFEAFAGIGAQHKAISNIDPRNKIFKIVKTSEWDARAIIAYAQIHHRLAFTKQLIQIKTWNETKINGYLLKHTFSLDSKRSCNILRKDKIFKTHLIAANIVNKNFVDIKQVHGQELKDINLLTYSFPCQGLSNANMGRGQGISENSHSTSNLIWEIKRLLQEASENKNDLPKYLLMENVMPLIQNKYKKDYNKWVQFLQSKGYETITLQLNGLDFQSLQARKRVFAISILNFNKKIKDNDFEQKFIAKYGNKLEVNQRKQKYFATFKGNTPSEINEAIPSDTPSRRRMSTQNRHLHAHNWKNEASKFTFKTLTTKQDRHPNVGMIKLKTCQKGKLNYRFITTREAYKIMGFSAKDFNNVKKVNSVLTQEALYRQAGNSIIVSILEAIFKFIIDFERNDYV